MRAQGLDVQKYLIKSGAIISVDPDIGRMSKGDVLIEGDRIAAIAPEIEAPDAEVVDATRMIVIPGLVNAHIHLWQTILRGIGNNWGGSDYYNYVHAGAAPRFTPDDTRVSTYAGALSQINAGTTTLFDWCHNNTTPEHTDAAIEGLTASGVRALFGHGTVKPKPKPGDKPFSEIPHPRAEIERLRRRRFAADSGLVQLAMCILGPDYATLDVCRQDFTLAREYDLISSAHVWGRANRLIPTGYRQIAAEGLLTSKHNLAHANYIENDEIKVIVDHGASITATGIVEIKNHAVPPLIGRVKAQGGTPSIANDTEVGVIGTMFATMRMALMVQRLFDNIDLNERLKRGEAPEAAAYIRENLKQIGAGGGLREETTVRSIEALEWATINNARALGLESRIGSLTPGKKADIVLLTRDTLNMAPAHDPIDAAVMFAETGNVDTVFIDGKPRKRGGVLLDIPDLPGLLHEIGERGRGVLARAGFGQISW